MVDPIALPTWKFFVGFSHWFTISGATPWNGPLSKARCLVQDGQALRDANEDEGSVASEIFWDNENVDFVELKLRIEPAIVFFFKWNQQG